MANSTQLSEAAKDEDLRERLTALAASKNIDNAPGWVDFNMRRLVAVSVDGTDVATVYEYAQSQTKPVLRAGENPALVTDDILIHAIEAVNS